MDAVEPLLQAAVVLGQCAAFAWGGRLLPEACPPLCTFSPAAGRSGETILPFIGRTWVSVGTWGSASLTGIPASQTPWWARHPRSYTWTLGALTRARQECSQQTTYPRHKCSPRSLEWTRVPGTRGRRSRWTCAARGSWLSLLDQNQPAWACCSGREECCRVWCLDVGSSSSGEYRRPRVTTGWLTWFVQEAQLSTDYWAR